MKRLFLLITTLLCLALPTVAYAASKPYDPLKGACKASGNAGQSTACGQKTTITGPHGVIEKASVIVASLAGIAAVIILIVGGLLYVTSAGDAQKAASARSAIIGAVVGLVIIASAEGILTFVLRQL